MDVRSACGGLLLRVVAVAFTSSCTCAAAASQRLLRLTLHAPQQPSALQYKWIAYDMLESLRCTALRRLHSTVVLRMM